MIPKSGYRFSDKIMLKKNCPELALRQRRLDVPADRGRRGPQMVEHTRWVVERAGDEQHKHYHQLGHGDLDRTGLSEGALLPGGLPAWSIVDRRTVFSGFSSQRLLQPRFPSLIQQHPRGGPPAVAMTKRTKQAAA